MLNQLIEQLSKVESVESRFEKLQATATKMPTTPEDLKELVKLVNYKIDDGDFPQLKLTHVLDTFKTAKPILVESIEYFYI
jgi:hypothetical protein